MKGEVRAGLSEYDGKTVAILKTLEARFSSDANYINDLIDLLADVEPAMSDGSTWLLKSWLENGGELSKSQTKRLTDLISTLQSWVAQLHICQSIGCLRLDEAQARKLVVWLTPLLSHRRPFLRAWSLDALCAVGEAHSHYWDKARSALQAAQNDEAASVRARVRKLQDRFRSNDP